MFWNNGYGYDNIIIRNNCCRDGDRCGCDDRYRCRRRRRRCNICDIFRRCGRRGGDWGFDGCRDWNDDYF